MANNIYVGGFPYKTTKEDLAKLFSACGTVLSAKVILDRETGRPKGFGFVEMSTDAEAKAAVAKLNGAFIGDRKIFVVEGRVDKTRPQGRFAGGESTKPSFAPKPAAAPGFIERRSGKDRRQQAGASDRRDSAPPPATPAAPAAPFAKKPWEKKPWAKKPFDAARKPWEKKPYDPSDKDNQKPWAKKPFDAAKKPWEKKPFDASKKPFDPSKKPFVRKPPARGPKWVPKKD